MRGPDEATIIHRTLEQALAHDGAVVLADFLIITNTYPVSRRNGRLANVHDLTSPHVERVGRLHHEQLLRLGVHFTQELGDVAHRQCIQVRVDAT